ncbi:MAG: outer membrane protein transport protein [Alistipes sp.]
MKKIFLLFAASALTLSAFAEGYQVNTLSSKQNGMGHVGVAMKLNSESIHFNPAATVFQTSKFSISAGLSGIKASATYIPVNDYSNNPIVKHKTDNGISTPIYAYFNYKPIDKLALGVGFTTPFGSSMKWDNNWVGAHLIQEINLSAYTIQPTISYKICDKLSIGAGLMITWGNFDLSRAMLPVGVGNQLIAGALTVAAGNYQAAADEYQTIGNAAEAAKYAAMAQQAQQGAGYIKNINSEPLVSAKLKGDAKVAFGVNIGILYDINEEWSLGFSYRSRMNMKATKGTAELIYRDATVAGILAQVNQASVAGGGTAVIPALNEGTFTAELPMPTNLTWGVSFRPTPKWEFAVDLQWVGWSAYENLNVVFNEPELKLEDINSVKNYNNTLIFRFGSQYRANDWLTARMGMYVDESPVRSDYLNPETPSMTKMAFTAGLSLRPTQYMSIDLSYGYIASADPERTGSYPYEIQGVSKPFSGNYRLHAHTFSVGLGFAF